MHNDKADVKVTYERDGKRKTVTVTRKKTESGSYAFGISKKESTKEGLWGTVKYLSVSYTHLMHISPYEKGNIFNRDPLRVRKLLLHKSEINKLAGQIKMKGYTLMPVSYTHLTLCLRFFKQWIRRFYIRKWKFNSRKTCSSIRCESGMYYDR